MRVYSFEFKGKEFLINSNHFDSRDLLTYGLGVFVEPGGNCVIYDTEQIEYVHDEYRPYLRLKPNAAANSWIHIWGATSLYKFGSALLQRHVNMLFDKSCQIRDVSYMFDENKHIQSVVMQATYDMSYGPIDAEKMFFHCPNLCSVMFTMPTAIYATRMFDWCRSLHSVTIKGDKQIILYDPIQAFKGCEELLVNEFISHQGDLFVHGDCYQMFWDCKQFIHHTINIHSSGGCVRLYNMFKNWKLNTLNIMSDVLKTVIRSPFINSSILKLNVVCSGSTVVLKNVSNVNDVMIDGAVVCLSDDAVHNHTALRYVYCTVVGYESYKGTCFPVMEHCTYRK